MKNTTCYKSSFPYRMNIIPLYMTYLRWFKRQCQRLGLQNTIVIWNNAFSDYDDTLLVEILSTGWQRAASKRAKQGGDQLNDLIAEFFPKFDNEPSNSTVRNVIDNAPPISQILHNFSTKPVEKQITAYDVLLLRFDGLACLAEALIKKYGKQGELIVYDLMIEGRLASGKGETGSVEEFIDDFTSEPEEPTLFTAGLEVELISKTEREAVLNVKECEWARFFQERHPGVGYLMACSTDEVAYKAFNRNLRLQRTQTLMEGSDRCDFKVFACDDGSNLNG